MSSSTKALERLLELARRHPDMVLRVDSGVLTNHPWWQTLGMAGDLERVEIDLVGLIDQMDRERTQ